MKTKEIFVASQAKHSASDGIAIGSKITESPVGPGVLTDISDAGYPRVNHVAVTCLISESGFIYQGFPLHLRLLNKKDNSSFVAYYKLNDKWILEGAGDFADATYPTPYKEDLHWKVKIFDQDETCVLDGDNL